MNDYLQKRAHNLTNQAQDILERPGFIEAVAKLAKKWNPNLKGIKTLEESEAWYGWLYQEDEKFMQQKWPSARAEILKAQDTGNFREEKRLTKVFNDARPINAIRLDIEKLMADFNIEQKWYEGIKRYMLTSDPKTLTAKWLTVSIHEEIDFESGRVKELSLILTKDTILDDIKAIWKDVKYHQAQLPGISKQKNVAPRNRERDADMDRLQKDGTSYDDIGKKYGLSYDQVSTILRNYRRRTGKS